MLLMYFKAGFIKINDISKTGVFNTLFLQSIRETFKEKLQIFFAEGKKNLNMR